MNLGYYSIPIALLLSGIIAIIEIKRRKSKFKIDLLFGINIMYLICYGIVPVLFHLISFDEYHGNHWINSVPKSDSAYFFAGIVSLIGYTLIISGYYFGKKVRFSKAKKLSSLPNKYIFRESNILGIAFILFFVGGLSLYVYVASIGGFINALETAHLYRSGIRPIYSKWLFLKNLAPVVMISSFLFYALLKQNKGKKTKLYKNMFIISFGVSIYLLLLLSGRLGLVRYIVVFPLFKALYCEKTQTKFVIFSLIFSLIIIVFGDSLFRTITNPDQFFQQIKTWNAGSTQTIKSLLVEFSFPYINLTNLMLANRSLSYRFFSDIFIGVLTLLPQSLLGIKTPDTLSRINTIYYGSFGTIPVDLLSFGFYSFNIPGVLLVAFAFGMIIRWFDGLFPSISSAYELMFRAAWIIFLTFRIMYGDPSLVMQGGFELFLGTFLLILVRKPRKGIISLQTAKNH